MFSILNIDFMLKEKTKIEQDRKRKQQKMQVSFRSIYMRKL